MGVTDVPQWLPAAFIRSAVAAGATAPREQIEATCRRLLERWREPDRRFHNVRHLIDVLARVDELAQETHDPELVRLAAWYHGAVFNSTAAKAYSRSGGEDEGSSAELAAEELRALGVPERNTARVAELINNLKRHEAAQRDIDCLALCDADLATLAADPQKYRAYRKAVREEYAHIPTRHYVEARSSIVSKLLARRHLFLSPMGAQWENRARENLTAELDRLNAELARLGEAPPEESVRAAEEAQGTMVEDDHRHARHDREAHLFTAHAEPDGTRRTDGAGGPRRAGEGTTGAPTPDPAPPGGGTRDPGATSPSAATPASGGEDHALHRRDPAAPVGRAQQRTSSLESMPGELDALLGGRRPGAPVSEGARDQVARSSRERIEEAVRLGAERAERERRERERLDALRAEREANQAPRHAFNPPHLDPSGALLTTAASPSGPEEDGSPAERRDGTGRRGERREPDRREGERRGPDERESEGRDGERPDRERRDGERTDDGPRSGIEREPDLFRREPRRRRDRR